MKQISDKRQKDYYEREIPERIKLCERCDGEWVKSGRGGHCEGGKCEWCGRHANACPPDFQLHPHELIKRSHGGKVSATNSRMLCAVCHDYAHLRILEDKWKELTGR